MPIPKEKETEQDYIQRCMADSDMNDKYSNPDERYAVCIGIYKTESFSGGISFDYDGTLSTKKGKELAANYIKENKAVYIVSARNSKEGMIAVADKLGIPHDRIFATGSNQEKIKKVKELGTIHYDNNIDVIKELKNKGKLI
jgi:hypothetical protein